MQNAAINIISEIKKVIVGKDEVIAKVLMAILSKGHVLLEDVPGTGKTTLAVAFSKVLGLDYKRIQFTSDSLPSDVIGFSVYDKNTMEFVYKPGAAMTNLLLADEINRTSSKTQSALLETMEEKQITVDGVTRKLPDPFVVLATQNPVGSAGTQMLPSAQMDRFIVKLSMGYPDLRSQIGIMKDRHQKNPIDEIKSVVTKEELIAMQDQVEAVFLSDAMYDYIARLTDATRHEEMIQLGVSPRGALALCRMVKAYAFISGRDYAVPEDVAAVFKDVCGHRIIMSPKAKITDLKVEEVLDQLLAKVSMPEIQTV